MKTKINILVFLWLLPGLSFAGKDPIFVGDLQFVKAEYINKYTIRVPFKIVDHLILVEAATHGQKGNFIIDTGSEKLILNSIHFRPEKTHISSTASSVSGILDDVGTKKIDSLAIAHFGILNQNADVVDLSHIEKGKNINVLGIIGYRTLRDYEVFIDFYLKQITLSKTDRWGNKLDKRDFLETIRDSISFTLKKHTIVMDCYVNNIPLRFALDTGAEINMINNDVPKGVLKNFRPIRRIKLTGMKNKKKEVIAGKLYKVKLNDKIYCGVMRTIIANLNGLKETYGTKLDGVMGYEFIGMKRLIINYKKEKIYFVKLPFIKKK